MDDILKIFRVIAPEYAEMTDLQVTGVIELFAPMVSKHTFGAKYNLAVAYYIAHTITLQKLYTTTAGASSNPAVGGVKREKEGDLEREYAVSGLSDQWDLTGVCLCPDRTWLYDGLRYRQDAEFRAR